MCATSIQSFVPTIELFRAKQGIRCTEAKQTVLSLCRYMPCQRCYAMKIDIGAIYYSNTVYNFTEMFINRVYKKIVIYKNKSMKWGCTYRKYWYIPISIN